jgi:hypothetical protein
MSAIDDLLLLEKQSERLGVLWRSQGQEFLDEQAAELQDDVERLRDAYLAGADAEVIDVRPTRRPRVAKVIDLRGDHGVSGRACSTADHGNVAAVTRCSRCHDVFCARCILQSEATRGRALCTECALIVSGVHHKRTRPLVAPARKPR